MLASFPFRLRKSGLYIEAVAFSFPQGSVSNPLWPECLHMNRTHFLWSTFLGNPDADLTQKLEKSSSPGDHLHSMFASIYGNEQHIIPSRDTEHNHTILHSLSGHSVDKCSTGPYILLKLHLCHTTIKLINK